MRLIGNKSRCQLFADSRAQVQCIIAIWLGWQVEFSYYLTLLKVNLRQRSRWRRRRRRRSNRSDVIVVVVFAIWHLIFASAFFFLSFLFPLPMPLASLLLSIFRFSLPPPWKASSGSVARQRFIDLQAPRNDSDSNLDLSEDVVGGGRRSHIGAAAGATEWKVETGTDSTADSVAEPKADIVADKVPTLQRVGDAAWAGQEEGN